MLHVTEYMMQYICNMITQKTGWVPQPVFFTWRSQTSHLLL